MRANRISDKINVCCLMSILILIVLIVPSIISNSTFVNDSIEIGIIGNHGLEQHKNWYPEESSIIQNNHLTRSRASSFEAHKIHKIHGGSLAGGLAHSDLDQDGYQEIVVVSGSSQGRVTLIDYNSENQSFESQLIWWDPDGALVEVDMGELDSSSPGDEIVVGGFSGNLTLLYYDGNGGVTNVTIWNTSVQKENTTKLNHIFGIIIGDLDDRYPGNEIAVVDASTNFIYIIANNGAAWIEMAIPVDDLPRNVFIGDFDNEHTGDELLVVSVNGTVYSVMRQASSWSVVEIYRDSEAPLSAVIDDFNATHPGSEAIITGLSKNTTLLWGSGNTWYNKTIWHAFGALEGMAYGDFDELHDGKELCIAGYSNTAVMLYETPTEWYNEQVFYDPDPLQTELNGVAITDFYPGNPGTELLLIGFTGWVWVLTFNEPDFELSAPSLAKSIKAGEFTTYQINLKTTSDYNRSVQVSLTDLPPGCNYNFSKQILTPGQNNGQENDYSVLTIHSSIETTPATYNITITGSSISDNKERALVVMLTITPPDTLPPGFDLRITPSITGLNLSRDEYNTKFNIKIIPTNQFDGNAFLYIPDEFLTSTAVVGKLEFSFSTDSISSDETAELSITVSKDLTESVNFKIPVYAENTEHGLQYVQEIILNVTYYQKTSKPGSDNGTSEAGGSLHQWVSVGLLLIVIIIIGSFMLKRMRDISRLDEQRKERLSTDRSRARSPGQYRRLPDRSTQIPYSGGYIGPRGGRHGQRQQRHKDSRDK